MAASKKKAESQGRLRFGTAGVPHSSRGEDPVSGVEEVARLGLSAMELEFVYGVRIQDEMAERVRRKAEELKISLTCHGPYYINLNSQEKDKKQASIQRILDTARAAQKVGAHSITFHAAFYMKEDPPKVHQVVREALQLILETLHREGNQVQVRPELTGKASQYGNLEELLSLSSDLPGVFPCIDFSHLHARSGGAENSLEEFRKTLSQYQQALGKAALQDLHLHVSGIDYSEKGERKHLELKKSDLHYKDLLRALKEFQCAGVVVCESPNLEQDALLLQKIYQKLRV